MKEYPSWLLQAILPTMEDLFAKLDAEEERARDHSVDTLVHNKAVQDFEDKRDLYNTAYKRYYK